jgi:hypothetical protein
MKKVLFLPLVLIASFCFAQDAKEIIGKPFKIGNLLVAENDFPEEMNWDDAKEACRALGKSWRLPSKTELNILYKNRKKIGAHTTLDALDSYWSSTEFKLNFAWGQWFSNGLQSEYFSKSTRYSVRAVRNF